MIAPNATVFPHRKAVFNVSLDLVVGLPNQGI